MDAEVEHMIEERIQKMNKLKQSLKLLKVSLSVFQKIRIISMPAVKRTSSLLAILGM